METNGIDNKFKEVLEKRRIAPSEGAWDKLDDALGATATPKRKGYRWYGIAAGFTGILLVSVLYFSGRQEGLVNPSAVVKAPVEEKLQTTGSETVGVPEEVVLAETNEVQPPTEEKATPPRGISKPLVPAQQVSDKLAANTEIEAQPVEMAQEESSVTLVPAIDTKIAEVLARVQTMEKLNRGVSDAEIDSMLRAAQKELEGGSRMGNTASVDALALLSDVEDELNRSLRDQLFEKLKEGYLKVRTAVAYRND
jgi:hypothetical protein